MKRSVLFSALCLLVLIGCTKYRGIKPLHPDVGNPNYITRVDSLTPTFRWEPWSDPNVTYDLIVYEGITEYSFWKGTRRAVGGEVYYREALQETVHEIEEPLKPDTEYHWSLRIRRGHQVSDWSRYDFIAYGYRATNYLFIFKTPKEEDIQEQEEEKEAKEEAKDPMMP